MFKAIKEWLFGPHNPSQVQTVEANTVAIQAQGDVKVTLPTESEKALAVKDWPFPGYGEKEVGKKLAEDAKAADAAAPAPVKKPRKPRAKKAK